MYKAWIFSSTFKGSNAKNYAFTISLDKSP